MLYGQNELLSSAGGQTCHTLLADQLAYWTSMVQYCWYMADS